MKTYRATIALLLMSTAPIALSSAANAQTAGNSSSTQPDDSSDIIVTATRDARSLQDVPMSVVAVKGDDIQKLSILDARDVQQLAPGLDISGRQTTLRGVTFQLNSGTSAAVQLYINEVPSDPVFTFNTLFDVEQIEVLRGPQGLLRGISSPGGAITIRTRRPDFDGINGYAQATVSDHHGYNVQGAVSLPFSDQFAIRAAAVVDGNRGNQVYNVSRGEWTRNRTESGRLTLGWQPSANFTAYLTYTYLQSDLKTQPQVFGPGNAPAAGNPTRSGPPASLTDRIAVQETDTRTVNTSHVVNLNADLDLGWGTLSFIGGRQDIRYTDFLGGDVTNAVPGYLGQSVSVTPRKEYTAELRLQSDRSAMFSWGVGAYYQSLRGLVTLDQSSDNFAFGPVLPARYIPIAVKINVPLKNNLYGVNANARLKLGDVSIEGGVRYAVYKKTQSSLIQVISPIVPLVPPRDLVPAALQDSRDEPITGGLNITYEPTRDLTIYAAFNRSFRQSTAGVGAPAGVSNDLLKTDSELSHAVEAGVKAALFDRRMNVSVIGFYQSFDGFIDQQESIRYNCRDIAGACNPNGPPINNATDVPLTNGMFGFNYNGKATVKGVEAQLDARPTSNWDFSLNLAYSRARYSNALLPCNDFNGDGAPDATGTPRITGSGNVSYCASNGRLANVPDFSGTATTELRFPLGNLTPFARGLASYRPSFFSDRSAFRYPNQTLINLYLGLRGPDGRWEVFAMAKNLLNQQRITGMSLGEGVVPTAGQPYRSGYRSVTTMTPREFSISTLFRF